ncbi:MAG: hypothetical protein ACI8TQ_000597 [Planctomycetota bacterium]|jgi:hypothetical protein
MNVSISSRTTSTPIRTLHQSFLPSIVSVMNHRLPIAAILLALSLTSCRAVKSSSSDVEVAVANSYIFRGLQMNDGYGVEAQGRISLARGDGSTVSGYAWGYLDGGGKPGEGALETANDMRFSRLDTGAQWSQTFNAVNVSAGVASYNFPNTLAAGTSEAFIAGEYTDMWLRPGAVFYYDFQNARDLYVRVGFHPKVQFDRALSADLALDVGYMGSGQTEFYYDASSSGISDLLASGTVTYQRDEHFRAFGRMSISDVLNSDLSVRLAQNSLNDTNLWFVLGFGWNY